MTVSDTLADQPWCIQVDVAMIRGNSPHTCLTLLEWLRNGSGYFVATDNMTASAVFNGDTAEIGHVAGRWNDDDAAWMFKRLRQEMVLRGAKRWVYNGRKGWARFLESREYLL